MQIGNMQIGPQVSVSPLIGSDLALGIDSGRTTSKPETVNHPMSIVSS